MVMQWLQSSGILLTSLRSDNNRRTVDEWRDIEKHLKSLGATVVATEATVKDVYSKNNIEPHLLLSFFEQASF